MKYSSPKTVLFISKLKLTVPIFIWTLVIWSIFDERYSERLSMFKLNNLSAFGIAFILYLFINSFTWNHQEIISFIDEKNDPEFLKSKFNHFFIILFLGIAMMLAIVSIRNNV